MTQTLKIAVIQTGPAREDKEKNLSEAGEAITKLAASKPDFVVLPELFATKYWCAGPADPSCFNFAEAINGLTIQHMTEIARTNSCCIITPFFEKGSLNGEFYNSAAVVSPKGLVQGTLPSGKLVSCYRKNYISRVVWEDVELDETYYFRKGHGYPIFEWNGIRFGILICYDRWFPEGWRILALRGAELIFVPNTSAGYVSDMFVCGLRSCAAQNQVFCAAANRAGLETIGHKTVQYYGLSCIIDPVGKIIAQATQERAQSIIAEVDLEQIKVARNKLRIYRDRRPELYSPISEESPET